ncbi:sugar phosphate isomerase/epimerase [Wenyingzhuangia heitensis]|uniref:Sugar phosphate isomerase/epimerase n=1 Tax=Wenyingzhuangia heitensis TaxID=1487859 RepID=A0ABX0UAK4_9FLAO|nr:sugar phosphate isomerase/epimerase [Wenyingzhuangia heitensis]NIJ44860.1 sugar phosphate isomerase/epimerase [Wenyingzhuangia heitensis]
MRAIVVFVGFLVTVFCVNGQNKAATEKLGWTLSVHTVSFADRATITQSLDSIKAMGFTLVDTYRGKQHFGNEIDTLHYWLEKSKLEKVKQQIVNKGLEINHFGVINGKDEKEWRDIFEFAKFMGVKLLICEPEYDHLEYVDQLTQEFGIKVGIHNHAVPTKYWHPKTVMTLLHKKKISKNIGIYPDINNWVVSGLNPVEMLQLAKGRIIGIQIKDRAHKKGMMPWGTGDINVSGIFRELQRQEFKGNISFEYFGKFSKTAYISKSLEYYHFLIDQLISK